MKKSAETGKDRQDMGGSAAAQGLIGTTTQDLSGPFCAALMAALGSGHKCIVGSLNRLCHLMEQGLGGNDDLITAVVNATRENEPCGDCVTELASSLIKHGVRVREECDPATGIPWDNPLVPTNSQGLQDYKGRLLISVGTNDLYTMILDSLSYYGCPNGNRLHDLASTIHRGIEYIFEKNGIQLVDHSDLALGQNLNRRQQEVE